MPAGGSEVVTARRHYVATFVLDPSVEHFPSGPSSRHRTRPKPFVSRRSCGHAALNHTDAAADFEIENRSRLYSREQLRGFDLVQTLQQRAAPTLSLFVRKKQQQESFGTTQGTVFHDGPALGSSLHIHIHFGCGGCVPVENQN